MTIIYTHTISYFYLSYVYILESVWWPLFPSCTHTHTHRLVFTQLLHSSKGVVGFSYVSPNPLLLMVLEADFLTSSFQLVVSFIGAAFYKHPSQSHLVSCLPYVSCFSRCWAPRLLTCDRKCNLPWNPPGSLTMHRNHLGSSRDLWLWMDKSGQKRGWEPLVTFLPPPWLPPPETASLLANWLAG